MMERLGSPAAEASAAGGAAGPLYVYGFALPKTELGPELTGVGDPPRAVRAIEAGGLLALVSDVEPSWTAATRHDVEAHERVLSQVVARGTVVPMRFGVVLDSDQHVRDLLVRDGAELREVLDRVRDRVQMSVKAFYAEDALLRAVVEQHPELKRRSDALNAQPLERTQADRIALGQEIARAVEERRASDQEALLPRLTAAAVDARVEPPAGDRQLLNVQLLVDRERRHELDEAVRALQAEHAPRIAFRYVGPLAPYSFTDMVLESGNER